ncbi:MAG: pyridoxamine 5'-phosphate oxidase [Saprospiraceae bacterium]|jgi:pyridoxamine 5'-phosphate oxidase
MSSSVDIEKLRLSYSTSGLDLAGMPEAPWPLFSTWFEQIVETGSFEPNAMIVATATPDGHPSQRTVLLKSYDEHGFMFYTNYESRKGQELDENDQVSLIFPWISLHRQVIVQGTASKVSRENSLAYFRSRPRGSQIGAWASAQSSVIDGREPLMAREQAVIEQFEGKEVELPPYWGGFNVVPQRIEFWQGRENRLHDRFSYSMSEGVWKIQRLSP